MTELSPSRSGTYFVQDQHNPEELLRLADQDQLVTASMGGVLPEQADPARFQKILDVACGIGGWLIEAAQTYPHLSSVGIDLNPQMIASARARAAARHVEQRVTFRVMDALSMLDFPNAAFDLVNLRFASSFVRTWEWSLLLHNVRRVLRPGGVIRLTDEEIIHQSTSPASMQFCELLLCALFRSGHLFTNENAGLTGHLTVLLTGSGYQQVRITTHALHYQAGTPEGEAYARDGVQVLRMLRPFLEKWGCITTDYDALRQQVITEVARPDFSATWKILTASAIKPA